MRIGEALAVTWNCLLQWTNPCDCESTCVAPASHECWGVEIRGTVIRIKGKGLVIKPEPKSEAGFRTLKLTTWAAAALRARKPADALPTDPCTRPSAPNAAQLDVCSSIHSTPLGRCPVRNTKGLDFSSLSTRCWMR
ncbi:site-specific integrase [Flindersiella endophytica]